MPEPVIVNLSAVDLPPWARVEAWDVSRWAHVLDTYADQIGDYETRLTANGPVWARRSDVEVPGLGRVPVHQLAALVHRTLAPAPVRGVLGWLRAVLRLEPVHVRQRRLAWRIRVMVYGIVHAEVERRRALLADLRPDPFWPNIPDLSPPPKPSRPNHSGI